MEAKQYSRVRSGWKLSAVLFLAFAFFACPLAIPAARAGGSDSTVKLVAALNGVEILPDSAMAKESAGGVEAGEAAGVHLPLILPKVRLWDDFGTAAASPLGQTTITVSGGSRQP